MKIVLINNLYPPYARGGAEQVIKRTVDGILEQGHEVVLVTSSPETKEIEVEGSLKIYRVKPRNIFFYTKAHEYNIFLRFIWHIFDIFNFSVAGQVEKILLQEKPDIVHTHNLMGLSFLIPGVVRKLSIPHIHTVHDVQLVEPSGIILKQKDKSWRYNGLPTKLYTWLMKSMMGSPSLVISPSQFLLDFYKSRGFFSQSSFVVVRNPVTFDVTETSRIVQDELVRFLYLGQVEEHKGVRFLVEAFVDLLKQNKVLPIQLHIVGDGSLLSEIENLSFGYDKVVTYGKMEREALPNLFNQTDVLIVPSLCYENSPTVIFESFSFGVPILASDVEGVVELIEPGENGISFEAGNKASLQDKIIWCVENQSRLTEMGKKTSPILMGLKKEKYIEKLLAFYVSNLDNK